MSAFLGKIHYWLYDKIKLQEIIIEMVAELAETRGFNSKNLLNECYSKYGHPVKGLLENEIEHTNIHGWLQEQISSVEMRLAYVVTELLNNNIVNKEDIAGVFYQSGVDIMKALRINTGSPEDFYSLIFDYMLEGMPCDRVNDVIENSETIIIWKTTIDIHRAFWDEAGGDVNNFNYFRVSWINGLLSESDAGYKYSRTDDGINTIRKG